MSDRQERRNYYEILNSKSNATFDELKANYKQLILQCHPDKLQQDKIEVTMAAGVGADVIAVADDDPNTKAANKNTEFVIINEAWNTLKDPVKRKHYDAELLLTKFQMHSNIFERLTLNDMTMATETEDNVETYYTYNCRCGGQYIIDESAAKDNGLMVVVSSKGTKSNDNKNTNATTYTNDCANTFHQHNNVEVGDKGNKTAAVGGEDDDDDDEVMVECSECSLVIILSNVSPSS